MIEQPPNFLCGKVGVAFGTVSFFIGLCERSSSSEFQIKREEGESDTWVDRGFSDLTY